MALTLEVAVNFLKSKGVVLDDAIDYTAEEVATLLDNAYFGEFKSKEGFQEAKKKQYFGEARLKTAKLINTSLGLGLTENELKELIKEDENFTAKLAAFKQSLETVGASSKEEALKILKDELATKSEELTKLKSSSEDLLKTTAAEKEKFLLNHSILTSAQTRKDWVDPNILVDEFNKNTFLNKLETLAKPIKTSDGKISFMSLVNDDVPAKNPQGLPYTTETIVEEVAKGLAWIRTTPQESDPKNVIVGEVKKADGTVDKVATDANNQANW